jgi:hypothetical protein
MTELTQLMTQQIKKLDEISSISLVLISKPIEPIVIIIYPSLKSAENSGINL